VAAPGGEVDRGRVQYTSASFLYGPLLAFAVVGVFVLLLRWTYRRGGSVVSRPGRPGRADDYGALVPVASPGTYVEGEVQRRTLEAAGVRANLASTLDGPRVLVFPGDAERAREILARS
jgi:hypothetical protein